MKRILQFILALLVTSALYAQPSLGAKAPDFTLPDANGKNISLSSLKGKVVMIDFWASWCRPCRQSNKQIQPLYEQYQSKGFEVLGVSLDDRKSAWLQAVKQDKIKWLQVIDPNATRGSRLLQVWNIQFIPSTFLLDKNGVLLAMNPDKDELKAWLKKLL
jgi:peroxiredoxin